MSPSLDSGVCGSTAGAESSSPIGESVAFRSGALNERSSGTNEVLPSESALTEPPDPPASPSPFDWACAAKSTFMLSLLIATGFPDSREPGDASVWSFDGSGSSGMVGPAALGCCKRLIGYGSRAAGRVRPEIVDMVNPLG